MNSIRKAEVTATQLQRVIADVINRVQYGGERITVTRRGQPVCLVIPIERVEKGGQKND